MGSYIGTMHTFKILLLLSALCWESHTSIPPEVGEKIAQFQTNYEDSEVRERRDADPGYLLDKIVCKLLKCHKKSFGKLYEKPYERPQKSYDHYKSHSYKKKKHHYGKREAEDVMREKRNADPSLSKLFGKSKKSYKSDGFLFFKPRKSQGYLFGKSHKSYSPGLYKSHGYKKHHFGRGNPVLKGGLYSPGLYKSHGYKKHHFGRGNPVLKGGLELD